MQGPSKESFVQLEERNRLQLKRLSLDIKRILAPTDLTSDGMKAVEYALALAEHFNAQLTLLNVYEISTTIGDSWVFESVIDAYRKEPHTALNKLREEIKKSGLLACMGCSPEAWPTRRRLRLRPLSPLRRSHC